MFQMFRVRTNGSSKIVFYLIPIKARYTGEESARQSGQTLKIKARVCKGKLLHEETTPHETRGGKTYA